MRGTQPALAGGATKALKGMWETSRRKEQPPAKLVRKWGLLQPRGTEVNHLNKLEKYAGFQAYETP